MPATAWPETAFRGRMLYRPWSAAATEGGSGIQLWQLLLFVLMLWCGLGLLSRRLFGVGP